MPNIENMSSKTGALKEITDKTDGQKIIYVYHTNMYDGRKIYGNMWDKGFEGVIVQLAGHIYIYIYITASLVYIRFW